MNKDHTDQNLKAGTNYGFCFHTEPDHPIIKKVYAYWQKQAGDREMPFFGDIDPIDIPALMPHVTIGEIIDRKNMSIRVRLFGTALSQVTGDDRTGMTLEQNGHEAEPPDRQEMIIRWRFLALKCIEEERPLFTTRVHSNPSREFLTTHTAVLPLSDSSGKVERIMAAMATVSNTTSPQDP